MYICSVFNGIGSAPASLACWDAPAVSDSVMNGRAVPLGAPQKGAS
jgi:hypothetical protein